MMARVYLVLCLTLSIVACSGDKTATDMSTPFDSGDFGDLGARDLSTVHDSGPGQDLATCAGTAASCGMAGSCLACAVLPNATASCTAGACTYACSNGAIMCGGACTDVMVDSKSCGQCGRSCMGANCDTGTCQPFLLGEELQLVGVATDQYNAYVTDSSANVVAFTSIVSGGAPTLFAKNQNGASGIAVDHANVYWTAVTDGTVNLLPVGSMMGTQPTLLAGGQKKPTDLAIDADNVYWVNTGDGTVMQVPIKGGKASKIASGQSGPLRIVVDATNVYWSNSTDGSIMQIAKNQMGNPLKIASGQNLPNGIAADANNVYWVNTGDGTINRVLIGGGPVVVMAMGQKQPNSIVVDASNVYWTNYAGGMNGTAMKLALKGNVPVPIAQPPFTTGPSGICLDSANVYVVDKATGEILRILK